MRPKKFVFLVIWSCLAFKLSLGALEDECGHGRTKVLPFVIGGERAKRNDWPWMAAVIDRKNDEFVCGGSLISEKHVLSGKVAKI